MNRQFVDAVYLIALVNPNDQWHAKAIAFEATLVNQTLITTEDVLAELLTFYAESGGVHAQNGLGIRSRHSS